MLSSAPLLGSTTPRLWTRPLVTGSAGPCGCGCALTPATSLGFNAVSFAEDVLERTLIPWQRWLLIHALEMRSGGRFRYRTILILVGRQNGKTSLVEIKNLWKMFVLRVRLIIGTAQNLDVSEESWSNAVEMVEEIPELKAELAHVDKTNGKKALRLLNKSRWKIAAASRRGGRGLSGDDVNLDELREHLDWTAWAAVTKTTMAKPKAQIWAFSNAGDDRSVVLNQIQAQGRSAVEEPATADPTLGLFEWSAPDDVKCSCARLEGKPHGSNCRLRDRRAWAWANPSLGYMVTEEALESALNTDPEEVFRTECLCQRVPDLAGRSIDPQKWAALADPASARVGDIALGVDIAPERDYAAISVYGLRVDELAHLQLVDYRPGTDWVVPRLAEFAHALDPVAIGMGRGTYASIRTALDKVGLTISEKADEPKRGDLAVMTASDNAAACGHVIDAVRQGTFRYIPAEPLDIAVAGAKTRLTGDSIAWSRKDIAVDISPLGSFTAARWTYESRAHLIHVDDYDVLDSVH